MDSTPIQVTIAGVTLKLNASSSDDEVLGLAAIVEEKLREINPKGRPLTSQMCLVVAMSLAHEVQEQRKLREQDLELARLDNEQKLNDEKARRTALKASMRDLLRRVVSRIDFALEEEEEEPEAEANGAEQASETDD